MLFRSTCKWLYLENSKVTTLPDNLTCEELYLGNAPVTNVTRRENCGKFKRTIYCAWVNGGKRMLAGCFMGTLEELEIAIDEKYSGSGAEEYKKAARECWGEYDERFFSSVATI